MIKWRLTEKNRSAWWNTSAGFAVLCFEGCVLQVVFVHVLRSLVGSIHLHHTSVCIMVWVSVAAVCLGVLAATLFLQPFYLYRTNLIQKCMSTYSAFVNNGAFRKTAPHNTTHPRLPRFIIVLKIGLRALGSLYQAFTLSVLHLAPLACSSVLVTACLCWKLCKLDLWSLCFAASSLHNTFPKLSKSSQNTFYIVRYLSYIN